MPFLSIRGAQLYYEDSGGPGEPIVFSHGLLWDSHLFSRQVEALRGRYRCISYDHRGQGHSQAPEDGKGTPAPDAASGPRVVTLTATPLRSWSRTIRRPARSGEGTPVGARRVRGERRSE